MNDLPAMFATLPQVQDGDYEFSILAYRLRKRLSVTADNFFTKWSRTEWVMR